MKVDLYQINAFTDRMFAGNPAAVCPLAAWLDDATMLAIAAENNLSETAFFVPRDGDFDLRWFTPTCEVDLCGHATLASAHLILTRLDPGRTDVVFHTRSGALRVVRDGDRLAMDFPRWQPQPIPPPDGLAAALGCALDAVYFGRDRHMAVLPSAGSVRTLRPDMGALAMVAPGRVIVTAPGEDCDFVSRFFAPGSGVNEDPVTGSSHCVLVPYWAARLGKTDLHARQISKRGGELFCRQQGDRVVIAGRSVLFLTGYTEFSERR